MFVLGTKITWNSLGVNSLGWKKYSVLCAWCKLVSQVVEMGQYWFFLPLHRVKVSTDPQLPPNTDFFALHIASPDLFQVSIFIRLDLDDRSPGKSASPLIASLNSFACYHVPSLPLNVWLPPLSVRILCCLTGDVQPDLLWRHLKLLNILLVSYPSTIYILYLFIKIQIFAELDCVSLVFF